MLEKLITCPSGDVNKVVGYKGLKFMGEVLTEISIWELSVYRQIIS
jgi:hypothetical protein